MVIPGSGEPQPVVCRVVSLVSKNQYDLVLNIDRQTTKHRASLRRQRSDCIEHELMGNDLALLDAEMGVVQPEEGRIVTWFRHRPHCRIPRFLSREPIGFKRNEI